MKPIDVQNACLLALQLRTSATSSRLARDLRDAGQSISGSEAAGALGALCRDGLARITFKKHPTVGISQPVYSLTAAGRIEAKQLPGDAHHG
ncbi:hypothetical protein R6258_07770 [Halomonas sp. HP20-15]|uniref:hypothetical protein n=1 Tax=Halomonas sp. HP20-15 TaxID=3085901 RepID=UPI002982A49E|nr:hypothetical protein [Halomonas sp. HP20-15]MDW5376817.1 hypothetical protein [Halomonas sp. HP20-15]